MVWILFIGIALASWAVSAQLQSRFKKYGKIPLMNGMTGKDSGGKRWQENGR